ncbi:hypothetical protein FIM12_00145 [SAR202 cluster bacterium AD-804-J14_MRT_500m]|nr:hypothetical protein [SAR202 cluster bacterium AD-804-J14_MRT_500m]
MAPEISRANLRLGSGIGSGMDHIHEILGCTEFEIYIAPNKRVKGYEALKDFLEAQGCDVIYPAQSHRLPAPRYQACKITNGGNENPETALRRAHRWAHQRNFLHSFFKPRFLFLRK